MIDRADGLPRAVPLDTERLRLTPLAPDDADELFRVLDDRRLHVFTGGRLDTTTNCAPGSPHGSPSARPTGGRHG